MNVCYCGTEDFVARQTGDAMASAIRDAVAEVDAALAARLEFDPESGGVGIEAPSERDLRAALEVARRSGLISQQFVDEVEIYDPDELEAELEAEEGHIEPLAIPMQIEAVNERGIVASFNDLSFPVGEAPATTIPELLEYARRTLGACRWADVVGLSSTVDHVLVEAPELAMLEQVADVLGTTGLGSAPEMSVAYLRAESNDRSAGEPRDWVAREDPDQPGRSIARGWSSDVVAFYLHGNIEEATALLNDHLATVDPQRAARVDVSLTYNMTVVLTGPADDVTWAADALRAPPA